MIRIAQKPQKTALEPLIHPEKTSGFTSPAEDYMEGRLNILERLIKDPVNTYYAEACSDELIHLGIPKGTIFVYDTSISPGHGSLVIVFEGGEWKVRQLLLSGMDKFLSSGRKDEDLQKIQSNELVIRGVITWSCRPHQSKPKNHVRSR